VTAPEVTNDREKLPSARAFWLWPIVYLVLRLIAPFIKLPWPVVATIIATVVFLITPMLWLRALTARQWPLWGMVATMVVMTLVWSELAVGQPVGFLGHVDWKHNTGLAKAAVLVLRPVADLALITAGASLGMLVARLIRDPKMLLPVAVAGAVVDFWGVFFGTTNAALKHTPAVVQAASAGIPTLGGGATRQGMAPISYVGVGDWLFLGLFLAVASTFQLQPRRTFWTLTAFVIAAMFLVLFDVVSYLPAIVPMAIAVLWVNRAELRLSRSEAFAVMYAVLMVAAMIGLYVFATNR
jgi:hypothetical protein